MCAMTWRIDCEDDVVPDLERSPRAEVRYRNAARHGYDPVVLFGVYREDPVRVYIEANFRDEIIHEYKLNPAGLYQSNPRHSLGTSKNVRPSPLLGQTVRTLILELRRKLRMNPEWLTSRALYLCTFLAVLAATYASLNHPIGAVFCLSGIFFATGLGSITTFALAGKSSVDPRIGIILCVAGFGTAIVAFIVLFN